MLASQSIRMVADELINMSENQDLISINLIGKGSTGKTELARTLSCLIHTRSKLPYNVNYFSMKQMLDLEETVKNLTPNSGHIIIFDDIAFLKASAGQQKVDEIQRVLSIIRHLPGGESTTIIMFKLFQYSKSIPPFLRQNDATFISSVDDNEIQNIEELLGKRYILKINLLKQLRAQAKLTKPSYFAYPLGNKGKGLIYKTKAPFLPFLYSNEVSCRMIVSPLRTWFQPICQTCNPTKQTAETKGNLEEFLKDFKEKFPEKSNAKTAVRIKLLQSGMNCFSGRINQACKYIDQYFNSSLLNLEDLAVAFDLEPIRTSLLPNRQPKVGLGPNDPLPKSEPELWGGFGFDVGELIKSTKVKTPVRWIEPYLKQSKEENLSEYHDLHIEYKIKPEQLLATKIKALSIIIRKQG